MKEPLILVVDDDEDIRLALNLLLTQAGYRVVEAASVAESDRLLERLTPDLMLLDMNFCRDTTSGQEGLEYLGTLPVNRFPVILMTAWSSIELAVEGIQRGADDFIEKPWRRDKLLNMVERHLACATNDKASPENSTSWVTRSKPMRALEELIERLAPTDANILILGENGCGKSMLAERIHGLGLRAHKPFVALNMAAVPQSLFESELFGHQKGAFTDAKESREGAFSQADGGTLLLDEIGALPFDLQPKLLQVLESGRYSPLGAGTPRSSDVRLIAATNRDLRRAVEDGEFRRDLLYRLNTFVIEIPPLRERPEDILALAEHYLTHFSQRYSLDTATLSPNAEACLLAHPWPGNIRELKHAMERAVLLAGGAQVEDRHLMLEEAGGNLAGERVPDLPLDELEKKRIEQALDDAGGHIVNAAKLLGISRNALYRRIEKYRLETDGE